MADAYQQTGQYDKSLSLLNTITTTGVLRIDDALVQKGLLHRKMGDENLAMIAFSDVVSQHPNSEYLRLVQLELKKFDEKTAKEIAIEKGDYVEYATRDEADYASIKLSEHIGKERKNWKEFTEDPKGFIERKEKEHLEWQKNLPFGTPLDFYSAAKTSDKMPDVEKGIMHKPFESKAEIFGHDFRNYLEANRTSIPFMKIRDYFYPPKEE